MGEPRRDVSGHFRLPWTLCVVLIFGCLMLLGAHMANRGSKQLASRFHAPQSWSPIERRIVPDLTDELLQQLEQHGIGNLFILSPVKELQAASLVWDKLASRLQQVQLVHSAAVPMQDVSAPSAVLLMSDGKTTSQSVLAASLASQLGPSLHMLALHQTFSDKPTTLVSFDPMGRPFQVAVLETVVFRDAFTKTYNQKQWGEAGGGSGEGSTLAYTQRIRTLLGDLLARYKITSMLDTSCGSMHWMPLVLQEHERAQRDFRFMGTDVVCSLIDRHKLSFANHTNWQFQCIDYSAQRLPAGYELVWSRDSLQHITWHAVWQFLNNVRASGAKYLLVGSYIKEKGPNQVVLGGDSPAVANWRIDLLKPPFNMSAPLEILDEQDPDGKHMLLFEVSKMKWEDSLQGLL